MESTVHSLSTPFQGPHRGWGWGGPPTFWAVDVRTLNVQLEIFKVLMKDGEFTCFDDILAKIKQLSEAEKCMITEIITLCKLLLVNPATSAAGERSFSSARRLKRWLRSTMTQTRFRFVDVTIPRHSFVFGQSRA